MAWVSDLNGPEQLARLEAALADKGCVYMIADSLMLLNSGSDECVHSFPSLDALTRRHTLLVGATGAGKTLFLRKLCRHLAQDLDAHAGELSRALGSLVDGLSSLGCARTPLHHSSSRHSLLLSACMDCTASVQDLHVGMLGLELCRINRRAHGDSNFHVLYDVCLCATPEENRVLDLGQPEEYPYNTVGGNHVPDEVLCIHASQWSSCG
jgi:hypothetical protein